MCRVVPDLRRQPVTCPKSISRVVEEVAHIGVDGHFAVKCQVRFTLESGHVRCNQGCPLRANSGHRENHLYNRRTAVANALALSNAQLMHPES